MIHCSTTSWPSSHNCRTSHTRMQPSVEPEPRRQPSGVKASVRTPCLCPQSLTLPSMPHALSPQSAPTSPSDSSRAKCHTQTAPSSLPHAHQLSSVVCWATHSTPLPPPPGNFPANLWLPSWICQAHTAPSAPTESARFRFAVWRWHLGTKARPWTWPSCAFHCPVGCVDSYSHKQTCESIPPERRKPSMEKARHLTPSVCAESTRSGIPVSATQRRTVLSELAVASAVSLGVKSTHQTCALWARSVTLSSGGSKSKSHKCTVQSARAAASTKVYSAKSNDHTGLEAGGNSRNLSNRFSL
mmetsp:Transcript_46507/g.133939  ORF Transcript_46507/g.133939 Transcript_46507/m.133939 type:complete len:300 (-) Transcript_46507:220-1119(-)